MSDSTHRIQVQYQGNVQGVGFRATVADLARGHEVTGWVKNLPDGRVHLEAQGEPAEVRAFLARVDELMRRHIKGRDVMEVQLAAGELRFVILR